MDDLRAKHVLVTGATEGLGPALVETLLAHGARVTAVARRRTALDELVSGTHFHDRLATAEGDVTRAAQVEMLFDTVERNSGAIHAVVHAVPGYAYGPVLDISEETIELLFNTLFLAAVLTTRGALRRMAPRRSGRIVLIGGIGNREPAPNVAVYGALKAAVAHFVQSVAGEVRDAGVTVNAVLPGVIDTPENRRQMPDADRSRWVAPGVVANAVVGLLGDGARGITGSLLAVPDRV